MKDLLDILQFFPKYDDIEDLVKNEIDAAYVLQQAIECTEKVRELRVPTESAEEIGYLVSALVDRYWERIHTGHFSEVPIQTRKIYALANYFKIFFALLDSTTSPAQLETCCELLDDAILIGCTENLYQNSNKLKSALLDYLHERLTGFSDISLPIIEPLQRRLCKCDIQQFDCPSVIDFEKNCFRVQQPSLLLNTIKHWKALHKWRDLNYLLKIGGNRTVPIEIGASYATEEWSQQLIKLRDFLSKQFGNNENAVKQVEYLAQHELFEQIPALKADICTPDYCTIGQHTTQQVDIKAWLGPKGTISPMHYDPKHNLLCQVFGEKFIVLAAPEDGSKLYRHDSDFLSNTSQIDAANLDLKKFPLAAEVKFFELTLQAGDCLYMPPKWWHYVRSESESFSVSFWWE